MTLRDLQHDIENAGLECPKVKGSFNVGVNPQFVDFILSALFFDQGYKFENFGRSRPEVVRTLLQYVRITDDEHRIMVEKFDRLYGVSSSTIEVQEENTPPEPAEPEQVQENDEVLQSILSHAVTCVAPRTEPDVLALAEEDDLACLVGKISFSNEEFARPKETLKNLSKTVKGATLQLLQATVRAILEEDKAHGTYPSTPAKVLVLCWWERGDVILNYLKTAQKDLKATKKLGARTSPEEQLESAKVFLGKSFRLCRSLPPQTRRVVLVDQFLNSITTKEVDQALDAIHRPKTTTPNVKAAKVGALFKYLAKDGLDLPRGVSKYLSTAFQSVWQAYSAEFEMPEAIYERIIASHARRTTRKISLQLCEMVGNRGEGGAITPERDGAISVEQMAAEQQSDVSRNANELNRVLRYRPFTKEQVLQRLGLLPTAGDEGEAPQNGRERLECMDQDGAIEFDSDRDLDFLSHIVAAANEGGLKIRITYHQHPVLPYRGSFVPPCFMLPSLEEARSLAKLFRGQTDGPLFIGEFREHDYERYALYILYVTMFMSRTDPMSGIHLFRFFQNCGIRVGRRRDEFENDEKTRLEELSTNRVLCPACDTRACSSCIATGYQYSEVSEADYMDRRKGFSDEDRRDFPVNAQSHHRARFAAYSYAASRLKYEARTKLPDCVRFSILCWFPGLPLIGFRLEGEASRTSATASEAPSATIGSEAGSSERVGYAEYIQWESASEHAEGGLENSSDDEEGSEMDVEEDEEDEEGSEMDVEEEEEEEEEELL